MKKLKLLDLFSGIGGFSLGLERTGGFETVAFCEIEDYPRRVLKKHWPKVPIYDDVRTLSAERLAQDGIEVDAICGGFPCQDLSLAGKGAGLDGKRSGLWGEIARLASELRPKYIIVENVSALLGRGMGRVLGDLAEIGYDAEWHCIQASRFGAPHDRDRVWIVANRDKIGRIITGKYIDRENAIRSGQQWYSKAPPPGWGHIQRWFGEIVQDGDWEESSGSVNGMVYGVSSELDEIAAHGNAVVPQIAEFIGNAILRSCNQSGNSTPQH